MKTEIEAYLKHLSATEQYDEDLETSVWNENPFAYDLTVTRCTSSAMLIALKFGGVVHGYYVDQTDAETVTGYDCGGHDFCVVGNLLIDYWAKEVNNPKLRSILDLTCSKDRAYIRKHYLPFSRWETLELWPMKELIFN